MAKVPVKRIHLIYSILLSIVITVAGISLMAACVDIYRSGDHPFSREAVAASFSGIAFPVYLCLVMVLWGFLLDFFFPEQVKKPKVNKQNALILQRLHSKTDLSQCDAALRDAVYAQQKKRKLHKTVSGILLALCCVVFLGYSLNGSNFHQSEINGSMIKAMYLMIPCLLVPFAYGVFSAFYSSRSIQKEISLMKQIPASKAHKQELTSEKQHNWQMPLRCAVLAVGIGLLVYGFWAGGTADVLTKAINICTECVGLG